MDESLKSVSMLPAQRNEQNVKSLKSKTANVDRISPSIAPPSLHNSQYLRRHLTTPCCNVLDASTRIAELEVRFNELTSGSPEVLA